MTRGLQPFQINEYLTKKIVQDLVISCTNATQVVIQSGSVVGADDGSLVIEAPADLTVDITVSGLLGLDTGTEAIDTWYYIYLIRNPSNGLVSAILSASVSAPTLPAGYTQKRLVGVVRNNNSSNFVIFSQIDKSVSTEEITAFMIGIFASGMPPTPFNLTGDMPPISRIAYVVGRNTVQSTGTAWILKIGPTAANFENFLLNNNVLSETNTNTTDIHTTAGQQVVVSIGGSGSQGNMALHVGGYVLSI